MCGIAAWAGKDPKKFDLHKLGILGIFNEKRGIDSCGMTSDYKIKVGVDENKVFKDFMQTNGFKAPVKHPFVIAHTRKSTGGLKDSYNAHPFGYDEGVKEKGKFSFVGVHNGSLINEDALAKAYNIDNKGFKNDGKTIRNKIDSEILLECIYRSNSFKVLEEYNGAAALVFSNIEEPNVLYCYHGASKSNDYSTTKVEEERPLFYWRENMNSIYISSMENSLEAICGNESAKKNIHAFDVNTVYKITNGDINKAEKFVIDRSKAFKGYIPSYNYGHRNEAYYDDAFGCGIEGASCDMKDEFDKPHSINLPAMKAPDARNTKPNPMAKHNIFKDRDLTPTKGVLVSHYRGRYKRNGHNITGCYCWIPEYGFYPLDANVKKAEDQLYDLCGKEFNNQNYRHLPISYKIKTKGVIPFVGENIINPGNHMYYFYNGVRLETRLDYKIIKDSNRVYTTPQLSIAATHPIMEETVKNKPFLSQQIFYKGMLASGTFALLGCNKIYEIEEGNCINIRPVEAYKMKSSNADAKDLFSQVNDRILKNEKDTEPKKMANNNAEQSTVKNIIFDSLFSIYNNLENGTQQLSVFSKNKLAIKTVKVIDEFVSSIEDIMENDLQVEINEKK